MGLQNEGCGLILTDRQEERLGSLGDAKVVFHEDNCPVVRLATGRLNKISREGTLVEPSKRTVDVMVQRALEHAQLGAWESDDL